MRQSVRPRLDVDRPDAIRSIAASYILMLAVRTCSLRMSSGRAPSSTSCQTVRTHFVRFQLDPRRTNYRSSTRCSISSSLLPSFLLSSTVYLQQFDDDDDGDGGIVRNVAAAAAAAAAALTSLAPSSVRRRYDERTPPRTHSRTLTHRPLAPSLSPLPSLPPPPLLPPPLTREKERKKERKSFSIHPT